MKASVRKRWERASRLMACGSEFGGGENCPIVDREPACYTDEWYVYGHNGLASLQLDGLRCEDLP